MGTLGYSVPSVRRAFRMLRLIADSDEKLGVSELARQMGLGKSTTLGLAEALRSEGALCRNPLTKKYGMGFTILELSRALTEGMALRDAALPVMERLRDDYGESVFLGVLNGENVTIVDLVEGTKEFDITAPRGTKLPIQAGATGKVFLAGFGEEKARRVLRRVGLPRYTRRSITDVERYINGLGEVERQGYGTDDEEYLSGVCAVAAVVETPSPPPAAIWMVGFSSHFDPKKMKRAAESIVEGAGEISRKLRGEPHGRGKAGKK